MAQQTTGGLALLTVLTFLRLTHSHVVVETEPVTLVLFLLLAQLIMLSQSLLGKTITNSTSDLTLLLAKLFVLMTSLSFLKLLLRALSKDAISKEAVTYEILSKSEPSSKEFAIQKQVSVFL